MCGIVGSLVLSGSGTVITEDFIVRMRDTMIHRGPDGAGVWVSPDGNVGLGHRRLAIIDLSDTAAQPMSNEDGMLRLVFNGEIYNHAEIRKELELIGGHRWITDHSDTEVIIHAFEQWGIDCIHKFRGMFAFALWDARKQELWLVRDRLGVKPLYYSMHHGRLNFASEIKALLQDPDQERKVNEESLLDYLSFLTTPAPNTLFSGIKKLSCATWLRVGPDGMSTEHRYWDVLDHMSSLQDVPDEQLAAMVLSELRTAVKLRKVSDVPVGVFLSGGIDSSTNAALFSEDACGQVKTFTIGYEGSHQSYRNELEYAKYVASQVGAEYHEKLLTVSDLIEFLPRMVRLQDEPIADPVCFPVYFVSKLARDNGVTVCQVGEGADELFWGYPGWKTSLRLQSLNELPIPASMKHAGLWAMRALGKDRGFSYEWLRRGAEGQPIFWGGAEAFTEQDKQKLLSPRLRKKLAGRSSWESVRPIYERYQAKAPVPSNLGWMSYLDLNLRLPELLLMRVDKMSMGVSLEGRVPFLDHKLVELAMSIPDEVKMRNGVLKAVLKKAVRGIIPDRIIDRPKQGFGVPVHDWFLDELGNEIRKVMHQFCDETDFFDRGEVMNLLDRGRSAQAWYLFNLALWWKEYVRD
jgi:asparagine synthase (glutamine-hydrolysing)